MSRSGSVIRTENPEPGAPAVLAWLAERNGAGVLLLSMADRWKGFAGQVARARERPTEKAIHDLRVASRRLIATLDIVSAILPGNACRGPRRQLKRHLKAFSALRDVQLQITAVGGLARRFDVPGTFLTVLKVRENLLLKRAKTGIRAIRLPLIERQISYVESSLQSMFSDPLVRDAARSVIFGSLGGAYTRAAELKGAAMSGKVTRIHRFRVALKRFRYAVEALQPLLPGATKELLGSMNDYQMRLGDIQDIDALICCVNVFADRRNADEALQCARLTDHLIRRRDGMIARFIAPGDDLGRFWIGLSSFRSAG